MHNEFAIDGHISPLDSQVETLNRKYYRNLRPEIRRMLDQYTLRCFRITDYLPDEPNELFYRLNQPTMLTAGERRNALYGPAREQLKTIVYSFEDFGNEKSTIGFTNARLAYDDIIARLLFFLENGSFGVKGTEARISDRFRNRNRFPDDVMDRTIRSVQLFSMSRREHPTWRFNKASLLSWLIFYSRFRDDDPSPSFMWGSCEDKVVSSSRNYVIDARRLFQDRASLRVTDVSSVVFQDFALWYAYYFTVDKNIPDPIPKVVIEHVRDIMEDREDVTYEYAVTEIVDVERWGASL